ncbi:hypothetical protein FACS1894219_04240 [Clostridia bacterium]|nr:hypothetical protein FACS1894219_04240 [Clostridia bacterium]
MAKFCIKCGSPLEAGAVFCSDCGAPLTAPGGVSAPRTPQQPQQPPVYRPPQAPQPVYRPPQAPQPGRYAPLPRSSAQPAYYAAPEPRKSSASTIGGIFAAAFVIIIGIAVLSNLGDGDPQDRPQMSASAAPNTPSPGTATPDVTVPSVTPVKPPIVYPDGDDSWAVYIYLCGSDLESGSNLATNDLGEIFSIIPPDNAKVVIQGGGSYSWKFDQFSPNLLNRCVWDSAGGQLLDPAPLNSMGDPSTLADFLEFCETNYPAKHTALILWDHGGGSVYGVCQDEIFDNDVLTLPELRGVMERVYGGAGTPQLDIIGFDACLMATVDTAAVFSGYADYMVASQENEPGCGWQQDGWLRAIAENPDITAPELGRAICDSYYRGCAERALEDTSTLSVLDLSQLGDVVEALDFLAAEGIEQAMSGGAAVFFTEYERGTYGSERYGGSYADIFGMVDLGSFVNSNRAVFPDAAGYVLDSLQKCVVYQVKGDIRSLSNGLSLYYPFTSNPDSHKSFSRISASKGLAYLYELMFSRQVSDEAKAYFKTVGGVPEATLELEPVFLSEDAAREMSLKLHDIPVTTREQSGVTYLRAEVGPDLAKYLSGATAYFFFEVSNGQTVSEEYNGSVYTNYVGNTFNFGEDSRFSADWDKGVFEIPVDGSWCALDGHLLPRYTKQITDDYSIFQTTLNVNGEDYYLNVSLSTRDGTWTMLGLTPAGDTAPLQASKEARQLAPGDKVYIKYWDSHVSDENITGYQVGETFTITERSSVTEAALPHGVYSVDISYHGQVSGHSNAQGVMVEGINRTRAVRAEDVLAINKWGDGISAMIPKKPSFY